MTKFKTEERLKYKAKTEKNLNEEEEINVQKPIFKKIKLNNKDYNILRSSNNSKKIFYHGQIKRKKNIDKNQILTNPSDLNLNHTVKIKINPLNQISKQNEPNLPQNKIVIRSRRINTSVNNNGNKNIANNSNSNINKMRKKIIKSNPKNQEIKNNNNINGNMNTTNPNYNNRRLINRNNINEVIIKTSPIKIPNKTAYIDIGKRTRKNVIKVISSSNNNNGINKVNYSIKNYNKINTNLDKNQNKNYSSINKDKNIKKEKPEKNALEEIKEIDYNESNENEIIEENNNINGKKRGVTEDEKFKKIKNFTNGAIKDSRNNHQKDIKNKRYYGYDDRHNLEGIINNHSIYYSNYTSKADKTN